MGQHWSPVRTSRLLAAAAAVSLTLALLGGCTPAGSQSPSSSASGNAPAASAKTLVIGATVEPATLDMTATAPVAAAQAQLYNVYETLVKIDGEGRLQPMLAQKWSVSADRKTYTFYLNPAAKFASGKPVTADAVAKNFERIKNTAGLPAKHKVVMALMAEAKAVDATTLDVTLVRPSNSWLYNIADTTGMVADPDAFASMATETAGSGPYALDHWTRGDSITLKRNPSYWGNPGRYDTVTFKYFPDPNAMNAAMLAGTIDIISNEQAPDALAQFSDTTKYTTADGTTNMEVTLGLNNASPALKDLKVRQAIAMAIDKKKLVTNIQAGHGTVIGSMVVPSDPYYEDLSGINAYNPQKAKALLTEAGATGLNLRFKPAAIPYATAAAQQIAADLKAVGITTTIEEQQFPGAWVDSVMKKGEYDLTIVGHAEARDLVVYTDPTYYFRYNNPAFAAQYLAADSAEASAYPDEMKKAARILADDAASVWLYMMPSLVVSKESVTGWSKNATTDSFDVTTITTR